MFKERQFQKGWSVPEILNKRQFARSLSSRQRKTQSYWTKYDKYRQSYVANNKRATALCNVANYNQELQALGAALLQFEKTAKVNTLRYEKYRSIERIGELWKSINQNYNRNAYEWYKNMDDALLHLILDYLICDDDELSTNGALVIVGNMTATVSKVADCLVRLGLIERLCLAIKVCQIYFIH